MDERFLELREESIYAATQARAALIAENVPKHHRKLADGEKVKCTYCEEELPPQRAEAGYVLCVPCKTNLEKLGKIFRRGH